MNQKYINETFKQAKKAYKKNEIPVGCIIVKNNKIIAKSYNRVEKTKKCTNHAEIIAINRASKKIKNWRLNDCEMYVTLEPCQMCKSAIKLSRIKKVYYFLKSDKKIIINDEIYEHIEKYSSYSKKIIQKLFIKLR